jgi:fengycin family lipopeptide synthetase B
VLVRRPAAGGLEETYFRTGDRVRQLEDGTLTFVARADRQVKVRGHRVELEEVEAALLSLPPVEEAAVFTVPDGEGSQAIQAAVVVGAEEPATPRDLRADLGKVLPPQAVPAEIVLLDTFPRTPTNKVDRNALRRRVLGEDGDDGE